MARLSKEQLGDRGRFRFNQDEVELPELTLDEDEDVATVLVRTPSVRERDELDRVLPENEKEWTLEHTAKLFSTIVVDPKVTEEEVQEFLNDWPQAALDRIAMKWMQMIGSQGEMRETAGKFRGSE